jgi:ABC-2 type transport system permease protein
LDPQRPIQIEAFISPKVPQAYVQQRLTLLNLLDELNKLGAGKIEVRVNPTERFTEEADRAEKAFGITARLVEDRQRGGARTQDHIFMGLAFKCGTQKVIVPFIDRGISAEYELVRSICTVSQQARKRVGVINTDAELMGPAFSLPFNPGGGNWPIIDELKKQYEVVQVDATQPIEQGKYDVLLAVQPSAMSPDAMDNFVRAVESGIPAAIFEDPLPAWVNVPGTSMPRRPPGMNPMMMMFDRGPREKGDIHKLWRLLGVDFTADEVIWQDYNPLQKFRRILPDELVFIDEGAGAEFAPDVPSSAGLQHVLFPFPGAVRQRHASELKFQPLVRTGERTGTVRVSDLMSAPRGGLELVPRRSTADRYVLAAHITGTVKVSPPPAKEENKQDGDDSHNHGDGGQNKKQDNPHNKQGNPHNKENKDDNKSSAPREAKLNVILVSDIDMLTRQFFEFRELTFVLNILDQLAGDDRFIELRSRRPKHRTLTAIEKRIEGAKAEANRQINKLFEEFESKEKELQQEYEKRVKEAEERQDIPLLHRAAIVATARREASLRREEAIKQLQQQRDRERERIETNLELERRNIERQYKFWAVVLPLVVPVSVGLCVFYVRRAGEKEGVAQSRLR